MNNFDPTDLLVLIVMGLAGWNLKATLSLTSRLDKVETELDVREQTVVKPTLERLKRVEHRVFGWGTGQQQGGS